MQKLYDFYDRNSKGLLIFSLYHLEYLVDIPSIGILRDWQSAHVQVVYVSHCSVHAHLESVSLLWAELHVVSDSANQL